jgi:excinuclease UvrABC helicase subunit UvrB
MGALLDKYLDVAARKCGRFINVDKLKRMELKRLLIYSPKTYLSRKVEILRSITRNDKEFRKQNKDFFSDMKKIIEYRNTFAHTMLDIRGFKKMGAELNTEFYKHSTKTTLPFTEKDVDTWIAKMAAYIQSIYLLNIEHATTH